MGKVTVICYGKMEEWKKRKDAVFYYYDGMLACDEGSSEYERYHRIHDMLKLGYDLCVDDDYTQEQIKKIQQRYAYVHSAEFDNYCVIPNRSVCEWRDTWLGFKITDEKGNKWVLCKDSMYLDLTLLSDYRKVKQYKILFRLNVDNSVELYRVTKVSRDKNNESKVQTVTATSSLVQFKRIAQSAVNRIGANFIRENFKL